MVEQIKKLDVEKTLVDRLCEAEDLPSLVTILRQNNGYDCREVVLDLMNFGVNKAKDTKVRKEDLIPLLIIESIEGEDEATKDKLYSVWAQFNNELARHLRINNYLFRIKDLERRDRINDLNMERSRKNCRTLKKKALADLGDEGMARLENLRQSYVERKRQLESSIDEDQICIFWHYTTKSGFPAGYLLFSDTFTYED